MNRDVFFQDFESIAALPLPWEQLRDKKILITGATGFIGGYLAKILCRMNEQMSLGLELGLFHRPGTATGFFSPCIRWIGGNITEDFIPKDFQPDIIIHGASPSNRRLIDSDPAGVIDCNILATRYLLEKARSSHAHFLFFSSGEVYQRRPTPIEEEDAAILARNGSLSFYGGCKLSGELLCKDYQKKYGVNSCILRLFSVFGPGESLNSGRCFTDFIRQVLQSRKIQVEGPGTQIRSYCYVSDFVSGLFYALLRGENTAYNIGNEYNTCSILEFARQLAKLYGNIEVAGPASVGGQIDSFVPDTAKLRKLGWQPQVDLQTCIKRCLESYCENSETGFK